MQYYVWKLDWGILKSGWVFLIHSRLTQLVTEAIETQPQEEKTSLARESRGQPSSLKFEAGLPGGRRNIRELSGKDLGTQT